MVGLDLGPHLFGKLVIHAIVAEHTRQGTGICSDGQTQLVITLHQLLRLPALGSFYISRLSTHLAGSGQVFHAFFVRGKPLNHKTLFGGKETPAVYTTVVDDDLASLDRILSARQARAAPSTLPTGLATRPPTSSH